MSIEHSPARQRKSSGGPAFPYQLITRDELAARLHCTPVTITRSYQKWGLRPVKLAGRVLFPSDQSAQLERKIINGEFAA